MLIQKRKKEKLHCWWYYYYNFSLWESHWYYFSIMYWQQRVLASFDITVYTSKELCCVSTN